MGLTEGSGGTRVGCGREANCQGTKLMTTISDLKIQTSGDLSIDGILDDYWSWNWLTRSGNTLYYYFPTSDDSTTQTVESAMSASTQANVALVFAEVSSITGIEFQKTTSLSEADIHVSMGNLSSGTAGLEWSSYDWTTIGQTITSLTAEAYVWLDTDYTSTTVGTYGYQVLLHEIGHAMGLDHPFEATEVPAGEDSWDYTVMSYTRGSTGIQTTYQENDILALQWLYGTDGLDGVSYDSSVTTGGTGTTPTVSLTGSSSVTEGSSGSKYATYTVSLSSAATSAVKAVYTTADSTATAGSDYTATTGTLTIAAGATSGTVQVAINGDTTYESDETFTLKLSSATNATVSTTKASVTTTITNDDTAVTPTVSLTGSSTITEGRSGTTYATYTVSLSNATSTSVKVVYATRNVTATAASDYGRTTGTVTIAAGATSATIKVPVYGDTRYESNETFKLALSSATNATLSTSKKTVTTTIRNDDSARMISEPTGSSSAMISEFDAALQDLSGSASSLAMSDAGSYLDTRNALCATTQTWGVTS